MKSYFLFVAFGLAIQRLNENARFVRTVAGNEEDVAEVDLLSAAGGSQATDFPIEGGNAGAVIAAAGRGTLAELLKFFDPPLQTQGFGDRRLVDDGLAAGEGEGQSHQGRKESFHALRGFFVLADR